VPLRMIPHAIRMIIDLGNRHGLPQSGQKKRSVPDNRHHPKPRPWRITTKRWRIRSMLPPVTDELAPRSDSFGACSGVQCAYAIHSMTEQTS
jgi:hypothetical protein